MIEITENSRDRIDFNAIQRVLVIKLQHLGDVLLSTPVFATLKLQFPHLQIDALIYQETFPILENNSYIDNTHLINRNWKKEGKFVQLQQELNLFKQLKNRKYDLIINLSDRWRGAWLVRVLQPQYSVSLPYSHRRGKFWKRSFTHIYRISTLYRHTVERNLDSIRRLGVRPTAGQKKLIYTVSQQAKDKIGVLLTGQGDHKKLIVIHPTSRWMFKAWNPEGFAKVIDTLSSKGFQVALISGPGEIEVSYAEFILQKTQSQVLNFAGKLSLDECGALISEADCFIGLDSVAMHIAASVNTACVVLFGPTTDKVWFPWLVEHRIIAEDFSCRPCGLKGCGDSMVSECLQCIESEKVVAAVLSLVGGL